MLTFDKDAALTYDAIRVAAVPMGAYAEQAERLQASSLREARVGRDALEGRLSLDAPGILQLSVPYSAGWTARIDGEPAQVLRSGVTFMALAVDAGEHTVALEYRTPWLLPGAAISALTLVGLVAWRAVGAVRRRRRA